MESFNYTTVQGDRWDTLAYKFYGNNKSLSLLTNANQSVALGMIIPTGTNIIVPIVDDTDEVIITKNVPPWKR